VTSTTNLIDDLVSTIGANDIKNESLMGDGVDPHLYRATARDLTKLRNADVIFYNGLHLEGKLAETLGRLAKRKDVYAVADALDTKDIINHSGAIDPHIWFDPSLWIKVAQGVAEKLSQKLPQHRDKFFQRFEKLKTEINNTASLGKASIKSIPKEKRLLITSHDAFHYFGRYFDIEVLAVQGLSTESEAGLRDIQNIIDTIKKRKVPAVFVESSVPRAAIERVEESSKAKIGGTLFSDALGGKNSSAGTYTGMLKHNIETIVKGLK